MKYITLICAALLFLFVNMGFLTAPIEYLVTIQHELGHAATSFMTGGDVNRIEISPSGGGFAETSGGNRSLILMGGYLGSILFANLLIFFGFISIKMSRIISIILFLFFTYSAIILFNSIGSSAILLIFGVFFLLLGWKFPKFSEYVLIGLGAMCLVDVIRNFNVHPKSDLEMYSQIMGGYPTTWMYLWLFLALIITGLNAFLIYRITTKKRR